MARKTLLTEGEIRQFMKLADLTPIGTVRLSEMGYDMPGKHDDEDELEDELHGTEGELGDMDADVHDKDDEIDDLEADLGAADDELGMDDMGGGGAETAEELVVDLLGLVQDWAESHNVDMAVDTAGEEEMGVEDEVVVDDEVSLDGGGEGEEELEMDMGVEDEMALEEDAPAPTDDLVAEVARRVAQRLAAENSKQEMVDELTERIFNRITKS